MCAGRAERKPPRLSPPPFAAARQRGHSNSTSSQKESDQISSPKNSLTAAGSVNWFNIACPPSSPPNSSPTVFIIRAWSVREKARRTGPSSAAGT